MSDFFLRLSCFLQGGSVKKGQDVFDLKPTGRRNNNNKRRKFHKKHNMKKEEPKQGNTMNNEYRL